MYVIKNHDTFLVYKTYSLKLIQINNLHKQNQQTSFIWSKFYFSQALNASLVRPVVPRFRL